MAVFMVEVVEEEEDKPRAQQMDYQALADPAAAVMEALANHLPPIHLQMDLLILAVAAEAVVEVLEVLALVVDQE
jgi:hypothetical protein